MAKHKNNWALYSTYGYETIFEGEHVIMTSYIWQCRDESIECSCHTKMETFAKVPWNQVFPWTLECVSLPKK